MTTFEALERIAHRIAVSETERNELRAAFLDAFGDEDEKKRYYQESEADKAEREAKEKFDAAVEAELKRRADEKANAEAVKKAADEKANA